MVGTARWGAVTVAGITALLGQTRALTTRPFGVNFSVAPPDLAEMAPECFAAAARGAHLVEFFSGWSDRALVETVHENGALACRQIGSHVEAIAAADAGCDFSVTQRFEAGGHVRSTIGLLALLDEVLAAGAEGVRGDPSCRRRGVGCASDLG
jgi:NAD(P)H-dependent flavin oxidoreductase YrpB (nitropropane dioxygenase family)